MATLVLIAAVCFAVLLLAAAALWWSVRRPASEEETSIVSLLPSAQSARSYRVGKPHPRLDLAAGIVASAHNVRLNTRRHILAVEESVAETLSPARTRRPDWAYYNENMGDISDPDLNRPFRRGAGTFAVPESR